MNIETQHFYWCEVHKRRASSLDKNGNHCCNPSLPGIMIPCKTIKITPPNPNPTYPCPRCAKINPPKTSV